MDYAELEKLNTTLIQLSLLVPLVLSGVLLIARNLPMGLARFLAIAGFTVPLAITLWIAWSYHQYPINGGDYVFVSTLDTGLSSIGIYLTLGLNGISMPLYLLAGIVGFSAGIYAIYSRADRLRTYLGLLLLMQTGLLGAFASIDIFYFYFFHEFALIPTFLMIGLWGGQGRRTAAIEMTVYLTLGAMLSLAGLISIYMGSDIQTFDIQSLHQHFEAGEDGISSSMLFGLLLFGFGILVSLFPFHSWAPRGYAAAPSSAAMLHAGVLKKFGLYGLVQIAVPLLPAGLLAWNELLIWLALGNIVLLGLVTMAQKDLKMMVGYASVMHMGYAFLGIAVFSVMGAAGASMLMFAHGLSAAALFLLSTSIFRRTGTYDLDAMGGLGAKTPLLAGFFVAAMMASIGLPGFGNFWGELTIFMSLWEHESYRWALAPAALGIVISAIYGLRAVAKIFFGEPSKALQERVGDKQMDDLQPFERLCAGILLVALLIVGVWPKTISEPLNQAIEKSYAASSSATAHTQSVEAVAALDLKGGNR